MKTRTTFAAALLLIAGSAFANPPGPAHDSGARLDRLAILLDLDEGQKAAVKQVFDEQAQQHKERWQKAKESQTRPSREEMHATREKMHHEMVEKLRPILSDTQMTKFEALHESPGPFGGPPPGSRPDQHKQDNAE
jgi:hypothetical protein